MNVNSTYLTLLNGMNMKCSMAKPVKFTSALMKQYYLWGYNLMKLFYTVGPNVICVLFKDRGGRFTTNLGKRLHLGNQRSV